jgi:Zn finger protein HypA/HybF involved in hydrogenase expression
MHEVMVAKGLQSAILAEAAKQEGKIIRAKISYGLTSAINDELLREGVKLEIRMRPIMGRCGVCGKEFEVNLNKPGCRYCKKDDFELLADEGLILEEVEFETG